MNQNTLHAWSDNDQNKRGKSSIIKSNTMDSVIKRFDSSTAKKRALPWVPDTSKKPKSQSPAPETAKLSNEITDNGIILSDQQKKVLEMVLDGHSLFFSGAAGTGKSLLLHHIIAELRKRHGPNYVAVTASTGLAAVNIGGTTLHSFAKIGFGKEDAETMIKRVSKNREIVQRWRALRVLIIDEISMIKSYFFDRLEQLARTIRKNNQPFGGVQLVLTGDFFQLPPVVTAEERRNPNLQPLCFESTAWKTSIKKHCILTEVFRQQGDQQFIEMLNSMREGQLSKDTIARFKSLDRVVHYEDGIEPTYLYSTRDRVKHLNESKINSLPGLPVTYEAVDSRTREVPQDIAQKYFDSIMAEKVLILKLRAQVILIQNVSEDLVNGLSGVVVSFIAQKDLLLFQAADFDEDFISMYNAISLARGNIPVKAREKFQSLSPNTQQRIVSICKNPDTAKRYPLVKFRVFTSAGSPARYLYHLASPTEFKYEDARGQKLVNRSQVPLILSWALSIHKSQGQTLQRVVVDLQNIFEDGQAYVAISRCTSTETLEVRNFSPEKIRANKQVLEFYRTIRNDLVEI